MQYRQKYKGRKTEFEFSEDHLRHYFSDQDEEIEFSVPYRGIDGRVPCYT